MRKILVGILVGGSLALATSAAFAETDGRRLGGQVYTPPSVEATENIPTVAGGQVSTPPSVEATESIPTVGGGQGSVFGSVLQKLTPSEGAYFIYVGNENYGGSENYSVPMSFYDRVQVGDVVKFDGGEWKLVKRAPATW